ncbi:MAG TPA: MOSC N-terminal beta barrel domain-containing protein [Solirubrobacteraceae bacterium]|jgi:hypothetical protein
MSSPEMVVAALNTTPIKGLRIAARRQATLERGGLRGDRRFFLIDERGRMVNGKHVGDLNRVIADLDEPEEVLSLTFPDGRLLSAPVELGAELQASFFSSTRLARLVEGPLSAALSEHAGQALRLVAPADGSSAIDRGARGAVSIISSASLGALARAAGEPWIDARRFRMSIEVSGTEAHAEDGWIGRDLVIGAARVHLLGHVGRCIITSRHPESGLVDLPTLDILRDYRAGAETTEPLAFGVHGAVVGEGSVSVGDRVRLA